MSTTVYNLKERIREELAEIMLQAVRKEAGVALTEKEHYRLKEKLMDALMGEVTI